MRHLSWLLQPVSPQTNTAGWWLMPQTLLRRLNAPASVGTGGVSSVCALLGICPWQTQSMWGASLSDSKKKWIGNKLIFSQLAVPFFPDLDPVQNKVADLTKMRQQRWHYWGRPPLGGGLIPPELPLSCQLWQAWRPHSCESPGVSKETPKLSILLTMHSSIGVYYFI